MLNVENLNIDFYNQEEKTWFKAVKTSSFQVKEGTVLGIVGESGSGKSVTSFSIMRLHDERIRVLVVGEFKQGKSSLVNALVSAPVCPVFDGTTYFTNILDAAAQRITFLAGDTSTFPPNYDEVDFPGYQF